MNAEKIYNGILREPRFAQITPPTRHALRLAYLASPYSHRDKGVMQARFEHAVKAAVWLMSQDIHLNVFSPIAHCHPMHELCGMRGDWAFWKKIDTDFLERADELIILCLPGWESSTGVTEETAICRGLQNINFISYLVPMGENNYRLTDERPDTEPCLNELI